MSSHPRWLLVCDLDHTLLGDDAAVDRFADWYAGEHDRIVLAYASDRSHAAVWSVLERTRLPLPAAVISDVGTRIHRGLKQPLDSWIERIPAGFDRAEVVTALATVEGLSLRPDTFQTAAKVSYRLPRATPEMLHELRLRLQRAELPAELSRRSSLDLDVLPTGINKGAATLHLAHCLEIPADQTVVCGGSGNDLSLYRRGFLGVVTAAADAVLRRLAGNRIYHCRSTHADGVLEGARHWTARPPALAPSAVA